jgi:hypothetical protein
LAHTPLDITIAMSERSSIFDMIGPIMQQLSKDRNISVFWQELPPMTPENLKNKESGYFG